MPLVSPLRTGGSLVSELPGVDGLPEGEAERRAAELQGQGPLVRGFRSAALGMSAGDTAQQSLTAELEGKAAQASALRQQALEQSVEASQVAPTINSYTQVHGVGDALDYAAGAVGQAIPTMAPSIAGALLLRGAPGGLAGKGLLSKALPFAGAYGPAYLQERNEAVLNQEQDPQQMLRSAQERQDVARTKGGVNAILESIVPATLGHGFLRPGSALRTIGNSVLEEGATEGLQEKVGQLAQSYLNPNRNTSQDNQNIIDASLQGALGGGGISTPTALSQVGANALQASAQKAQQLGKTALDKTAELGKVAADKTQLPERTNDLMDKLFRATDGMDLQKLKTGVMDPALAKGKDFAETLQNMNLREQELPDIAKRVYENLKTKAPEWLAKVDPKNPDSLVSAAVNADWSEKLKTFKQDMSDGFAAGKKFASKKNLMEVDPAMQGDLQKLLFDHLSPTVQDVQSVREALPSIASRLAALSARTGDLDKHDVAAMTDLSDTMHELFPDAKGLADKIKQYVKNTDPSLLDKILSVESATSDARQPGSFLELSLSETARKSGWDMRQVGKYVDKAVADPDNANYGVLRGLFGSTSKANQVLDYYQGKMQEQGIELDHEGSNKEEGDFEARTQGINPMDLADTSKPNYFFQHARSQTPFLASKYVESKDARSKMANTIKQAKAATGHLVRIRQQMVPYSQYAAEQGLDPDLELERMKADAEKTRDDATKKMKALTKEGKHEQAAKEQEKIFDANARLKEMAVHGLEAFKVMRVDSQDGDPNALDDYDITSMQDVLKRRPNPKDKQAQQKQAAIDSTRLNLIDPEGKPLAVSAESVVDVMNDRFQPTQTKSVSRKRQAFNEGLAALLDRGYTLAEGQDLDKLVINRRLGMTAGDAQVDEQGDGKLRYAPAGTQAAKDYAGELHPADALDKAEQDLASLPDQITAAKGPAKAKLQRVLETAHEARDNALDNLYPYDEDFINSNDDPQATAKELADAMAELEDMDATDSDAYTRISSLYDTASERLVSTTKPEGAQKPTPNGPRVVEEDTGLPIGVEKRSKGKGAKIADNRAKYAADKALAKQRKLNSQTGGAEGNNLSAEDQAKLIADLQKQRGPDLKVVFDDFFKVGGSGSYTYDAATGERTIKIALQAMNPSAVGWHEALHDFFQMLGGGKSSTKMRKEIEAVTSSQPVIRQLRTLLKDHPAALKQIETDAEERAAYAYQFFLQGQIRLGPATTTLFGKIHAFLARILHTISTGSRVEMALAALYQGHLADPNTASQVMAAIQANNPTYADRMQGVSNMLGNVGEKLFASTIERLDNTNIKALAEIGEAHYQPPDKQQDKMLPFLPRRSMARGVWANKVFKILEQHSHDEIKTALKELQSMDRTGPVGSQIGKILDDMFDYQQVAGVKKLERRQDPKTKEWETIETPLKAIDNYFPRVWDLDGIRQNPQALIDALIQHGGQTADAAARITAALMTNDITGKTSVDTADTSYVPFNASTLNREFDFINPSNAQHFAQFQSQDLGEILNTYVDQAVHRAEYARQFGNQGQWIEAKLKEAEAQGATPADMKMARAAVKGMDGTLGLDMSPELRKLMSGIITAENLILLPLALFSQVVDAVAIGARANSFKEALHALDRGFREVVKSFTKHADEFSKDDRLAMDLGIIDETAMLEAMGMTYQGMYMTKRLRNINRKFFRINRMEQWNRAMRVQGMVTGQRFILANKDNPRYMDELGLSPADIQELPDGSLAVTEADGLNASQARKMRTALFKFTDSAVLRPNAAHRPIWGNDPRFMLLIHLKQFSYSFQNVILKNMKKELNYGNAKPAMILLGAIPLIMMSDLLKNASTGNLDANLTFGQALAHGVARSGLLGTRAFYSDAASDLTTGHMPGVSFLGPTFEHALTITQGILGVPGVTPEDVITRSVPGGALIRNFTQ